MRVLVTGGTGFVGSHVVERLLAAGHVPVCLVRPGTDAEWLRGLAIEQVAGTLDEPEALRPVVDGVDGVVHVAGIDAAKARRPRDLYRVNAEGTRSLVALAARRGAGLKRFVFVSSTAAQGPSPGPGPRPQDLPPAPLGHYGKSKLLGEQAVVAHAGELPVTILRPPAVYGPRDRSWLASFREVAGGVFRLLGNPSRAMSLVYASDLAEAAVMALEREHPSGAVLPLDDGAVHTQATLGEAIGRALGAPPRLERVPSAGLYAAWLVGGLSARLRGRSSPLNREWLRAIHVDSWVCGNQVARAALGWAPRVSLDDGVRLTATWYRERGWLQGAMSAPVG